MISVIEQLKKQRKEMKMRQAELGKKLGLPQSHISKIEREETDPRFSTIQDMARILDHEFMLIPRQLIPFFNSMLRGGDTYEPRWKLDGVEEGDMPPSYKRGIW